MALKTVTIEKKHSLTNKYCTAKPFLKWAGGKRQLMPELIRHLPADFENGRYTKYVEPFLGGGALFFNVIKQYKFIEEAILLDANPDLINCYESVKYDIDNLIELLDKYEFEYLSLSAEERLDYYLRMRKAYNIQKIKEHNTTSAALMIFLNRTCFNGLYRLNKKGLFNVPHGKYKSPKICDRENLRAASDALQKALLICGDFTNCSEHLSQETFVYFDPPYRPISQTATFNSYSKDAFSDSDQIRLANFCKEIDQKAITFILSNSDTKY